MTKLRYRGNDGVASHTPQLEVPDRTANKYVSQALSQIMMSPSPPRPG